MKYGADYGRRIGAGGEDGGYVVRSNAADSHQRQLHRLFNLLKAFKADYRHRFFRGGGVDGAGGDIVGAGKLSRYRLFGGSYRAAQQLVQGQQLPGGGYGQVNLAQVKPVSINGQGNIKVIINFKENIVFGAKIL